MGWIDIVIFVIIAIFALIGLSKGLFESILAIFSSVISIVIAFLLGDYVANFVNSLVNANQFFADTFIKWGWMTDQGISIFGQTYTAEQIGGAATFIVGVVAVWILIKFAIMLLSKLFDTATTSNSAISGLNRLLGLVFGAAKGLLIVGVALALSSVLSIVGIKQAETEIKSNAVAGFLYGYVSEWVADSLDGQIQDFLGQGEGTAEGETPTPTPTPDPTPEGEGGSEVTPDPAP